MAVYKRGYEPYSGPLTPERTRFLIIARYAYARLFDSRFLLIFLVLCYLPPLVWAIILYLPHNAGAMQLFDFKRLIAIDGKFFFRFLNTQAPFTFLLAAFIGPGRVSSDLANNALPLYFCRPFTRTEYVLGKMSVLAILLSAITWVPGLLLFGFEAYLDGGAWLAQNWTIPIAIFVGSWIWILILCLLALALSAWVKWKLLAGALMLAIFFVSAGFGEAIRAVLHTEAGRMINIVMVVETIWARLFGVGADTGLSLEMAWTSAAACCGLCLYLLARRIRPFEVERS